MSESLVERVVLLHVEGPRSGEVDSFCQPTVMIGRAPDCHLVFPTERGVSGHHAVIRLQDGIVELEDTRSTNGTFVNDVRVDRCALKHEDTIRLGSIGPLLRIELPDRERAHMPLAPTPPPPMRADIPATQQAMPPAGGQLPRSRSTTPHTPLETPALAPVAPPPPPRVAAAAPAAAKAAGGAAKAGMGAAPSATAWAILAGVALLEIGVCAVWILMKLSG